MNAIAQPELWECCELRETLPGGRTKPFTALALDGRGGEHHIVLKLRRPGMPRGDGHYGATSLACELLCSTIARLLGLPVPDYGVVHVSESLAAAQPPGRRELLMQNIGLHFGCRYHEGYELWHPEDRPRAGKAGLLDELEATMAFDCTVINGDRNEKKPNLLARGDDLLLIDHSLALPCHLWPETVTEPVLMPEENVHGHAVYRALTKRGRTFRKLLFDWCERTNSDVWDELRQTVPDEWAEGDNVNRIFAFLRGRGDRTTDISRDLQRIVK